MDNAEMMRNMKATLGAALEQARAKRQEEDRRYLMSTVGQDIAKMIGPFLADVASSAKVNREEMKASMLEVMANVNAREMPGVDTKSITDAIERAMGNMYIPEPKVTVTSPTVNVPDIKMPDHMDIKGWVNLMTNGGTVGHDNPLPVMLMDMKGNPIKLFENLTSVIQGGSGGGKHDFFTVRGFSQSAFADHQNADGRLRVSVETGGSGLTDAELRAAHLDVQQVSGSIDSVYVTGASGTLAANIVDSTGVAYSGSNPVPVVFGSSATSASNIVDSSGVAYSGSNPIPTTIISSSLATTASNIVDSSGVAYSGSNPLPIVGPVVVTSITNTTASNIVDSTGVAYEGANPFPITIVTSATATVNAAITDSGGVQYSGSNPVPITGAVTLSGALTSSVVTGPVVSDAVDDNSAPVKIGGIARTANPTAVASGDTVSTSMDDLGRQVMRPVQVRDLIQTAYATFATGTEATLIAGVASTFLDLIYIMGANNSDAAVSVDIRSGTAGSVLMTLQIPASGTAGVSLPVPLPQEVVAGAWTVDLPDITGTTVSISALFSKEI